MKKKIIVRSILGFPIGITIGYVVTILISLFLADGKYTPCAPEFVRWAGSEINAVILQTALCGIIGKGFAAASVIWEMDNWSIARQTGVYFLTVSLIMLPVAYLAYWMEHSLFGFLSYFGIFVLIFRVMWVIQFALIKHNLNKINKKLSQSK